MASDGDGFDSPSTEYVSPSGFCFQQGPDHLGVISFSYLRSQASRRSLNPKPISERSVSTYRHIRTRIAHSLLRVGLH